MYILTCAPHLDIQDLAQTLQGIAVQAGVKIYDSKGVGPSVYPTHILAWAPEALPAGLELVYIHPNSHTLSCGAYMGDRVICYWTEHDNWANGISKLYVVIGSIHNFSPVWNAPTVCFLHADIQYQEELWDKISEQVGKKV